MSRWWRFDSDAINEAALQRLPPAVFRRKFFEAISGEANEFTPFIRRAPSRMPWPEWSVIRRRILARDLHICSYCLDDADQVDHVIPIAQGGSNFEDNLVAACRRCNASKGPLTPQEWGARDDFLLPPWFFERMARYG